VTEGVGPDAGSDVGEATPALGGGVLATATLLTFLRPTAWVVGLAGFLSRGGVILAVVPILVLPSLAGLATAFGPLLNRLVLGAMTADVAVAAAIVITLVAIVVVALLLVGGAVDGWLVGAAAADLGVEVPSAARPTAAMLTAARAIAHLPLVIVFVAMLGPVIAATYDELLVPGDLGTPVFVRVVGAVPIPIAIVVITALLCDALGALAVRVVALDGASLAGAIPRALAVAGRHPSDVGVAFVASISVVVIVFGPALVAASVVFDGLRRLLADDSGLPALTVAVLLLVGTWLGGLLLAGIASTWRAHAWSSAYLRATAATAGPSRDW